MVANVLVNNKNINILKKYRIANMQHHIIIKIRVEKAYQKLNVKKSYSSKVNTYRDNYIKNTICTDKKLLR